jgi:hypothetical protein
MATPSRNPREHSLAEAVPLVLQPMPFAGLTRGLVAAAESQLALSNLLRQYERAARKLRTERRARYEPR